LEGEEFDHLRPIINLREGLGWLPLEEAWKTPWGMQAGAMTLVHTALASLLGLVLPGWWALRCTALGWSLLAAAATLSLGRRLGAERWALAVTLVCLLPVSFESQLSAYGDFWESSTVGLVLLAVAARLAERDCSRVALVCVGAAAMLSTWLSMVLAPMALLSVALLLTQRRRRWIIPGLGLGLLPRFLLRGPGESLDIKELLAGGLEAWTSGGSPEPRWFQGWIDTASPLLGGTTETALAGQVVLGAAFLGLLLAGMLGSGRRGVVLSVGIFGVAVGHLLALELSGLGVPGGPVESLSWNYRRLALVHALVPLGGALLLSLLVRLGGRSKLRWLIAMVLVAPWLVASSPGLSLLVSPPERAGFSDPTRLILCHAGDGENVGLCLGDLKRPSLAAMARPWPSEPPSPNALATALRSTWSIINLDGCTFQSPPSPEAVGTRNEDASFAWYLIGRGLGGRCVVEEARAFCAEAPPAEQPVCREGVAEAVRRLNELGLKPARHE